MDSGDDVQSLVVRVRGGAATLLPTIKAAIWSVDSAPPITRVSMLEELVAASESGRRFVLSVFALFAATALLLTGIGLFGVIAGSVAERTREIGLRAALGARPVQILALVMRQGLALASLGGAVGLIGAVVTTRGLASLLYGVTALDPATYATVVALLACVCAAACVVPAWRAVNVHPTIALRSE